MPSHFKILRACSFAAGLLLTVIGIRFLLAPEQAARTFGLAKGVVVDELAYVIGLRDIWLGLLAIALAQLREWRSLALWFGFGVAVCWSDAVIAAASSGRTGPVLFHVVCGFACAALAVGLWRLADDRLNLGPKQR